MIHVAKGLPAIEILARQGIDNITDQSCSSFRTPSILRIAVLNLMPLKADTEADILRMLSVSPTDLDVQFVIPSNHTPKHTPQGHINRFYKRFSDIEPEHFDGMIVTGAPLERVEYEDVDYWEEMCHIMEWTRSHVRSTLWVCWGAFAALYYRYGIGRYLLDRKLSGVFHHTTLHPEHPLMKGMQDGMDVPHSRFIIPDEEKLNLTSQIIVLAHSKEAGAYLMAEKGSRDIFIMGHPEYSQYTLDREYHRDLGRGLNPHIPDNYYPQNNPQNTPVMLWKEHARQLYRNWIASHVTPQE